MACTLAALLLLKRFKFDASGLFMCLFFADNNKEIWRKTNPSQPSQFKLNLVERRCGLVIECCNFVWLI